MRHTLFISDIHLCDSRPAITQAFLHFLSSTARSADALYILGDLFEYWPGDDCIASGFQAEAIAGLRALSQAGVPIFLVHGNRDFLLGETFEQASGCQILSDPSLITLYDKRTLISHGDALCTDDVTYQQFRTQVRTQAWQTQFLAQPLQQRLATIAQLRAQSEQAKSEKAMQIMDVNAQAVEDLLKQFEYPPHLIHGHTHRPNAHEYTLAGHVCTRWVLGDWYEQGSYLSVSAAAIKAYSL